MTQLKREISQSSFPQLKTIRFFYMLYSMIMAKFDILLTKC